MNVVVDTNVLVSGIFWTGKPGKVIDYWPDKKIQLNVSEDILREYKRVITNIADTLNSAERNIETFSIKSLQKRKGYLDNHLMLDRDEIILASINEDRERIKQPKCLESINRRRDKFHAHFDKLYFTNPGQLQKDAPLKWSDLDLIVETLELIDPLSKDCINNLRRAASAFKKTVKDE